MRQWLIVKGLVLPAVAAVIGAAVDRGILDSAVGSAAVALARALAAQFGW